MKRSLLTFICAAGLTVTACGGGMGIHPATAAAATDDASITARVKTVLLNDTQVNATNINVSTANGVVTMTGSVKSKADEARAIQIAHQVSGVRNVISNLKVQS